MWERSRDLSSSRVPHDAYSRGVRGTYSLRLLSVHSLLVRASHADSCLCEEDRPSQNIPISSRQKGLSVREHLNLESPRDVINRDVRKPERSCTEEFDNYSIIFKIKSLVLMIKNE